jgi:hypothetical protein
MLPVDRRTDISRTRLWSEAPVSIRSHVGPDSEPASEGPLCLPIASERVANVTDARGSICSGANNLRRDPTDTDILSRPNVHCVAIGYSRIHRED